jgi:hypothetical protein
MWQPIKTAPKDGRRICACDPAKGYIAIVVWREHEWECVDKAANPMGHGFYPTMWLSVAQSQSCQCDACLADGQHDSSCPVHNGPALPVGACTCGSNVAPRRLCHGSAER